MTILAQFEIIGAILGALLYFVPAVIAFVRHHHNRIAILVLNVLLGWTFIGWVIALIWSLTTVQHPVGRSPADYKES